MFFLQIFLLSSSLSLCPSTFFFPAPQQLTLSLNFFIEQKSAQHHRHRSICSPAKREAAHKYLHTFHEFLILYISVSSVDSLDIFMVKKERRKRTKWKRRRRKKNSKLVWGTAESRTRSESERKRSICIRMCTVAEEQQAAAASLSQPQQGSISAHCSKREKIKFSKRMAGAGVFLQKHIQKKSKHEQRRRKKFWEVNL